MLHETLQDVDKSLQDAEQFLVEGKWRKAERLCEDVLRHSDQPKAAFLLAQVYMASGQAKRALELFHRVTAREPQNAEAHFLCGELLLAANDPQAAAASWIAGLELDPTHLPAHLGLSRALLDLALHEAAAIAARQALLVDSESVAAWDLLAQAAELSNNHVDAIQALGKCIQLRPKSTAYLCRLANLHQNEGDLEQGQRLFERAIQLDPRSAGLRFEYAQILMKRDVGSAALQQLREAVRLRPHFPEAFSNMGMLLRASRQFQESEAAYKKACAQNPNFALAWNNLANLYIELVRLDEAERCYGKAIAILPDYAEAHTGRAMLRLLRGRFEEGWAEYEWRRRQPGQKRRECTQPEWDGSDLNGRTILLDSEQGAGDTIQFIRYANILKQGGARILLRCPTSLRELMETMQDVDQVICGKDPIPAFDVHVPLMSLPRLCGTNLKNLPSGEPYLSVPTNAVAPEALQKPGALRVGLVWAGNPSHHNDRNRSIPSAFLQALLGLDGIRFFSLQLGGEPLAVSRSGAPVVDLAPSLTSYSVTAACLQHLDLLVTVDTSVAHLAGALGCPVWMMLPACNDWRWLLNHADSPWYPTMRIFRQSKPGDWSTVLKQIEAECERLRQERKS